MSLVSLFILFRRYAKKFKKAFFSFVSENLKETFVEFDGMKLEKH